MPWIESPKAVIVWSTARAISRCDRFTTACAIWSGTRRSVKPDACGGDALMRASAFQQVSGFDASIIAGEEPELCVRLRQKGWKI